MPDGIMIPPPPMAADGLPPKGVRPKAVGWAISECHCKIPAFVYSDNSIPDCPCCHTVAHGTLVFRAHLPCPRFGDGASNTFQEATDGELFPGGKWVGK